MRNISGMRFIVNKLLKKVRLHDITVFGEIRWIIRSVDFSVVASDYVHVFFLLINVIYYMQGRFPNFQALFDHFISIFE